jgi:hypothetical protein
MKYKDVSHLDLTYLLSKNFIDVEPFQLILNRKVNDYLTVGILGSSHYAYINLPNTRKTYTELLTCESIPTDIRNNSTSISLKDVESPFQIATKGYKCEIQILNISECKPYYEFVLDNSILSYLFDGKSKENIKPYTAISVKGDFKNTFLIHTIHSYPNESKLVYSKSSISINLNY